MKYLLTFRPFARLPAAIRRAYLAGKLHLLPFPGSLVFWGAPVYHALRERVAAGAADPAAAHVTRHNLPVGLRVPQAGFFHVPTPGHTEAPQHAGPVQNTFRRTHRWDQSIATRTSWPSCRARTSRS